MPLSADMWKFENPPEGGRVCGNDVGKAESTTHGGGKEKRGRAREKKRRKSRKALLFRMGN